MREKKYVRKWFCVSEDLWKGVVLWFCGSVGKSFIAEFTLL